MTDFYALLKQSILDRKIRDAGARSEVYAQARKAVVKQLWDFRPPLASDEIDARVDAYDTAVERIETDLMAEFEREVAAPPPPPPPPPPPKPKVAERPRPTEAPSKPAAAAPRPAAEKPAAAPARATARKTDATEPPLRPAYAGNGRAQTAAYAHWVHEEPPKEPAHLPARYMPPPPEAPYPDDQYAAWEGEEPVFYEEVEAELVDDPPMRRPRGDRWSHPPAREKPPFNWRQYVPDVGGWLGDGEQAKVRLLGITIGALLVVLVGVGAYLLGAHGNQGVTLDIGVRREVSDAATAARIPNDKLKLTQSFAVFDGHDPTIFSTTPDNPISFDSANGFVRVSSSTSASGVRVLIGPGLAARLAGQQVRIVVVARSSVENGAANMRFAYQSGLAISHWQTANLGSDYEQLGMLWRIPTMRTNPNGDFLLIEPGVPGDGTGVDIQTIRIDVLASAAAASAS